MDGEPFCFSKEALPPLEQMIQNQEDVGKGTVEIPLSTLNHKITEPKIICIFFLHILRQCQYSHQNIFLAFLSI